MRLIEDLGILLNNVGNSRVRYGIYECPLCLKHFKVATGSVVSGTSTKCRKCADSFSQKSRSELVKETLITRFISTHGTVYNYDKVQYINSSTKVSITCKVHGDFLQTAIEHIRGSGCMLCAKERSNIAKRMNSTIPTTLYYVYLPDHNLWKIGCTSKSVVKRFSGVKIEVLEEVTFTLGSEAYALESFILKALITIKYTGCKVIRGGNTEIITEAIDFHKCLGDAYIRLLQDPQSTVKTI